MPDLPSHLPNSLSLMNPKPQSPTTSLRAFTRLKNDDMSSVWLHLLLHISPVILMDL